MTESKDAASGPLSLAGDFPQATYDDWRKLVDAALKGAPFSRLESRAHGGLTIEPLYQRAAAAQTIAGGAASGTWSVIQRVDHPDPASANAQARDDIENGATGLALVFAGSLNANGFGIADSTEALTRTLDGIAFDAGAILDIDLTPFARDESQQVAQAIKQRLDPAKAAVRFGYDPVTAAAMTGKFPLPWNKTAPLMAGLVRKLADAGFHGPFAVGDGRVIHGAGGSEAQELAYALASAVAYLRALEAAGMPLEQARDAIYFRFAAEADQFLTVAKFRAARKLWNRIEAACGLSPKAVTVMAETAWRMMTRRDPYANMLRTTIAVAAAGIGGANAITVLPHTAPIGLPDGFARRIARNAQLVLLEESSLARVADPSAGSGAIEALTQQLCAAAWSRFQTIEKAGGAWAALEAGLIQRDVAAIRSERQNAIARTEDVLTGTNAFPDFHEAPAAVLDVKPGPTSAPASARSLPRIRLAEPFEDLRDRSDKIATRTGARPEIFLVTLGTPVDFAAPAAFAKNFFEAGGIGATEGAPSGYAHSGTALACLCSSDKIYAKEAPQVAKALKAAGAKHVYLAGRPGESETALRGAGVQSFIYAGCDLLATLTSAYDILG